MLKDVHNVGDDMLLCTRVILNFSMAKNEINLQNVRWINETIALDMSTIPSQTYNMYLVDSRLNYLFSTFSNLVVGIKFETKHC
jgi:hypothetical protein